MKKLFAILGAILSGAISLAIVSPNLVEARLALN
jgi:hypothetical protein